MADSNPRCLRSIFESEELLDQPWSCHINDDQSIRKNNLQHCRERKTKEGRKKEKEGKVISYSVF
eukprot:m.42846 g.42846  ORF g.42846 m.42846 type:complete len:65 (+) comp11980_c1_seq1:282-476(+)